jgi:hypothetical protein
VKLRKKVDINSIPKLIKIVEENDSYSSKTPRISIVMNEVG